MIEDPELVKAVAGILQRSEKQQDLQKLVGTFVDVGILPQIDNLNNQIIYGRRGTGKTHILRVLASGLRTNIHNVVVYIDARTLGSTNQFTDTDISIKQRCLALFRDIFVEIHSGLLSHIIYQPSTDAVGALASLDELSKVMLDPVVRYATETVVSRDLDKQTNQAIAGVSADSKKGFSVKLEGNSGDSVENEKTTSYRVQEDDKIIFPDLINILKEVLRKADAELYVLLDEWSSIPMDIQPYLAEFIKRGFLPSSKVIFKIASLEYRSNFSLRLESGSFVGFELGADISTAVDIDDYYVYDRNAFRITQAFADMLYKHIGVDLPQSYLNTKHKIKTGTELPSKMFTNKLAFDELVRASEGVARDLINIFNKAFFDAHRRGLEMIDKKAILEASRQWFEQDKENSLDGDLRRVLKRIVEEVIGHRKARSFMLPRELEKNNIIQKLFDARVLHLMQRGYADKDNPGTRYNIYTLDYGTYVDLINTSKQPQIDLIDGDVSETGEFIVPFDDKRSIRRIVLTQVDLN
jgi:Cdc6-like AAA superfamily ATPase